MYYHPTGSEGLYEYNFTTNETKYFLPYVGGDFIDANNNYAFLDLCHRSVLRYNLAADSAEVELNLFTIFNASDVSIQGIAAKDTLVYVLVATTTSIYTKLLTLTTNLEVLDIKDGTQWYCLSLSFWKGYLYSIHYSSHNSHIIKIDPESAQVLDSKLCPSIRTNAIKLYDGKFYFVDDKQKSFGYTPLEDIFN